MAKTGFHSLRNWNSREIFQIWIFFPDLGPPGVQAASNSDAPAPADCNFRDQFLGLTDAVRVCPLRVQIPGFFRRFESLVELVFLQLYPGENPEIRRGQEGIPVPRLGDRLADGFFSLT